MNQPNRVKSNKSIENAQTATYQRQIEKNKPHYFLLANQRNRVHSSHAALKSLKKDSAQTNNNITSSSFLKDPACTKYLYKHNTPNKKDLYSKQKEKFKEFGSYLKQKINISSSNKKQTFQTQKKPNKKPIDKYTLTKKLRTSPDAFQIDPIYFQSTSNNIALNRLRNNVKHIKTLQQQKQNKQAQFIQKNQLKSCSRSRSSKKKGLICTLYQKSQQKKINQSHIKSTKKLITIKSKYQKAQDGQGNAKPIPNDLKKILIKRKSKQTDGNDKTNNDNNNLVCFNSLVIQEDEKRKNKLELQIDSRLKQTNNQIPKPRKISSSSRQKNRSLKKSLSLKKTINKLQSSFISNKKPPQSANKNSQNYHSTHYFQPVSSQKPKKITLNQRIQNSLTKIHQKYKFVLNYMSDFDIISRLNGYQLAGEQQCKWILLLIDQVYEMIKNAEKTKLKGFDHTRNYQYTSVCLDNKNE